MLRELLGADEEGQAMTRVFAKATEQGIFPRTCPLNRVCSDGKRFCEHLESYIYYPTDSNGATLTAALVDCRADEDSKPAKK
jgi:hypothetical protein